jgi:Tfp pilus assembly protein PilN
MALQRLDLNLVPEPSLWERHHLRLGWGALAVGLAVFLGAAGVSGWTYWQAHNAGKNAVRTTEQARRTAQEQQQIEAALSEVDVGRELPRWRTAERVLQERALPWSRLISELEMDLPDGMRLRSIQRLRGKEGVTMKLKGEARTREAEETFIEALRGNPTYAALSLERENERNGGGVEVEMNLTAAAVPPKFAPRPQPKIKPKQMPAPTKVAVAAAPPAPVAAPRPAAPAFSTRTKPAVAAPTDVAPPSAPSPRRPQPDNRPGPMPSRRSPRPNHPEAS